MKNQKKSTFITKAAAPRAILVAVGLNTTSKTEVEASLSELSGLARTAGIQVTGKFIQYRVKADSKYYAGKGFLQKLKNEMEESESELLIFDDELTPSQAVHIKKDFSLNIMDRTRLILSIFYKHAKTRESRLQIRLAELRYELPRLKSLQTNQDRTSSAGKSGVGFATRGSGESKSSLTKKTVTNEIFRIESQLKKIEQQKEFLSKNRLLFRRVCLTGYTNAGKSTLFNALTSEKVLVEDQLFATLDSTTRKLKLSCNNSVLLTDTIGFVSKLPHSLVASFYATLKEVRDADLLIHVVDSADSNFEKHVREVNTVLQEINADHIPLILVLNKIDKSDIDLNLYLKRWSHKAIAISALQGTNLSDLKSKIENSLFLNMEYRLFVPFAEHAKVSELYDSCKVLESRSESRGTFMRVLLNVDLKNAYSKYMIL